MAGLSGVFDVLWFLFVDRFQGHQKSDKDRILEARVEVMIADHDRRQAPGR